MGRSEELNHGREETHRFHLSGKEEKRKGKGRQGAGREDQGQFKTEFPGTRASWTLSGLGCLLLSIWFTWWLGQFKCL